MKKLFVTGMARGLGLQLCKKYLEAGYQVFGCDISEEAEDYEGLKNKYGSDFEFFGGVDVGSTKSVEDCVHKVGKLTDSIDVLINNAAIMTKNGEMPLEECDIDDGLRVLNINSLGPLRVTKAFLPFLEKSEEKVILNISSEAGSISSHSKHISRYHYCMSKCALNMQSVILQRYLRERGIKVLAIYPGWMKTTMGGLNAIVDPAESTSHIFDLVQANKGKLDGDIFMDYLGKRMDW